MITLITGVPGSGKTAFAVSEILKSSKDVYVLNLRSEKFNEISSIDELTHLRNSVVLIDEAQAFLTSDKHKYFFETHRHHGLDIFLTTQGHTSIPRWLRPLIGRHVHITSASLRERRYLEWPRIANPLSSVDVRSAQKSFAPVRKEAFSYYKTVEDGSEIPPVEKRKFPIVYIVIALILPLAMLLAYYGHVKIKSLGQQTEERPSDVVPPVSYERTVSLVPNPLPVVQPTEIIAPSVVEEQPVIVGCVKNGNDCRCYDEKARIVDVERNKCLSSF